MPDDNKPRYTSKLYLHDAECVKRSGNDLNDLIITLKASMEGDYAYRKGMILDNSTGELIYQINNYS